MTSVGGPRCARDLAADSCATGRVRRRETATGSTFASARGVVQLGVAGTVAAATLAEAVHMAVLSATPLALGRPLTRAVYAGARGVAGVAGQGADLALAWLDGQRVAGGGRAVDAPMPLGVQAILNGLLGDRLDRLAPTVALPMRVHLHRSSRVARRSGLRGDVLFVHGLCMHDRHWQDDAAGGVDLGRVVAEALALRPLYLRYSSGVAIAENGRRLAALLERRETRQGRSDRPLHLVAHSLGGLVVRSAIASGVAQGHRWPSRVSQLVCLGTPHEGAPLERLGTSIEAALALSRFSAPWSMLGRLRSVAIRQLGAADVAAWPTTLGAVRVHLLAGCQTRRGPRRAHEHWGDGLVPVASALARSLPPSVLPVDRRVVLDDVGHLRLIRHPDVAQHLLAALGER